MFTCLLLPLSYLPLPPTGPKIRVLFFCSFLNHQVHFVLPTYSWVKGHPLEHSLPTTGCDLKEKLFFLS